MCVGGCERRAYVKAYIYKQEMGPKNGTFAIKSLIT